MMRVPRKSPHIHVRGFNKQLASIQVVAMFRTQVK
ncbi:hypothetical protein SAMN05428989_3405 [Pseudoxanthomonas sp. GM95]|nr:hypothetical protein SAMN05428989_3405 [Pseudoxanthomonas sp. GM95]